MPTDQLFIAGNWRPPVSGATYATINPANEETSAQVGKGDERDVDLAVAAARKAFDSGPWPRMSAAERGRIVWKLGDLIMQNLDEMARLESLNTGKTLFDSGKVEIPFAAEVFRYYAGWATKIHGETLGLRETAFTFTLRQPIGVIGAIVPWNFPFLLSSWKIAPALAAGNTVVLKPASLTPLTALKFADLTREAGLPEGVFNVVTGPGGQVGMAMVRDQRVDKIAFTGSTEVGKGIMREAAGTLKRLSLELGGKSPNIVFADADMEAAVKGALTGIFYNKGEVCAAGSRLLVEQRIHDEFVGKLVDRVKGLKVGDPMDKTTRMGPVVSAQQLQTVLGYVEAGRREGATLAAGHQLRALTLARLDVAEHGLHLGPGDDRAHPRRLVHRVADLERLDPVGQLRHEVVVDLVLEEQARAGGAHLALVVEDARERALHRRLHVGVGEDDVRRLAAELERDALERAGRLAHDPLAHLGRAREGDLVDARVAHQGHADLAARTRDDVEHPLGQPGLLRELGELERGERRQGRGLEHHGVAGGQRRRDLPRREQERKVPRHDRADHPDGLA